MKALTIYVGFFVLVFLGLVEGIILVLRPDLKNRFAKLLPEVQRAPVVGMSERAAWRFGVALVAISSIMLWRGIVSLISACR
jgi:hypothetical protein